MVNSDMLMSGIDIPFPQAQITIRQPVYKDISYIGEDMFFLGCEMLNFSKDLLSEEDKINLENKTNFDVLMSIIGDNNKNPSIQKNKLSAIMLLSLVFPDYKIRFKNGRIELDKEGEETHRIDNSNFESFKEIIVQMFCLDKQNGDTPTYNPGGKKAAEIAAKLQKGRAKAAQAKGEKKKEIKILARYVSILSVGLKMNINSFNNYTVYQLYDNFQRFEKEYQFDIYLRAKMAGAKDLKEADNWMDELHP
jgi:hypothetical protein